MVFAVFFLKAEGYLIRTFVSNRFIIEETVNDILVGTITPEKVSSHVKAILRRNFQGAFHPTKTHRFKFSEFLLVEWNASHHLPEFSVKQKQII